MLIIVPLLAMPAIACLANRDEPPVGFVHLQNIYAPLILSRIDQDYNWPLKRAELSTAPLAASPKLHETRLRIYSQARQGILYNWRISNTFFWDCSNGRYPFATFERQPIHISNDLKVRVYNWNIEPLGCGLGRFFNRYKDTIKRGDYGLIPLYDDYYDLLPIDNNNVYAIFCWRNELRVWKGYLPLHPKRDMFGYPHALWREYQGDVEDDEDENPFDVAYKPSFTLKTEMSMAFRVRHAGSGILRDDCGASPHVPGRQGREGDPPAVARPGPADHRPHR